MMEGDPYHGGSRFLKAADYRAPHHSEAGPTVPDRRGGGRRANQYARARHHGHDGAPGLRCLPQPVEPEPLDRRVLGRLGRGSGRPMVPMAHANDGGGSIRVPASECGLVGLKPSRGGDARPEGEGWMGATIDGVVSRSVRDTASMLDSASPAMSPVIPTPLPPRVSRTRRLHGPRPPSDRLFDILLMPAIVAIPSAGRGRQRRQAPRVPRPSRRGGPPGRFEDPEFISHFITIVASATAADIALWERELGRPAGPDDLEGDNLAFRAIGDGVSARPTWMRSTRLHAWARRFQSWWHDDGFDLLLTPTLAVPPPEIGYLSDPELGGHRVTEVLQYTAEFNVTGQPAVSLPLHWTTDGLPVGVQLVAPYSREDVLIRIAAQLETAQPWADRTPLVHA